MKIVYMGTPEFAVYPLKALLEDNRHEIAAVVTMPDKPAGRGQKIRFSDIKEFALQNNLPLLQPERLKDESFLEELRKIDADLFIVVAFRMLPEVVWNMPRLGTINLHASLLPQYRGAAPINWAIINGEKTTGLTTFRLTHEIDTGDIILQKEIEILEDDNAGTLHDKMALQGGDLVIKSVEVLEKNEVNFIKQTDKNTTLKPAPKIFKDTCQLDFTHSVDDLHNKVRGLSPYPAAWLDYKGLAVKVFETEKEITQHSEPIGNIISDGKTYAKVACSDGFLIIKNLQLSGKKRMNIKDLLLGYKF